MITADVSTLQFTEDLRICRLLNGMWQVSGAHGPVDPLAAIDAMLDYHYAGFTTWDLADHYGAAEDFIGEFRARLTARDGEAALASVQAFTKWVPRPGRMSRDVVKRAVDTSRQRMRMDRLDLLQFHWWDYNHSGYIDALGYLMDLRDAGKIRHLGLTNFDTEHLQGIHTAGIRVVSNQVQYSLVDRRPEVAMAPYCLENDIWLLPYGTVCGGFLSDKYLEQPEPSPYELDTASLRKYKQMIDLWGGWALFQRLLQVLREIGDKHGVSIANVAVAAILQQPAVAGVIIGARLGLHDHREANARVFNFVLDEQDWAAIDALSAEANDLYENIGDCGDEYRRR